MKDTLNRAIWYVAIASISSPVIAAGGACPPSEEDRIVPQSRVIAQCVRREAVALERSGERPSDIATAAIASCDSQTSALRKICGGSRFAPLLLDRLRTEVVSTVVRLRSVRRGG